MHTVKSFIGDLGGTVKVAERLELPVSTVSGWNRSNSIPSWRVPALEELASVEGKTFPEDLRPQRAA